nr:hypothetical protein [Tanacetum cinerariifolium]
MSNTNNTMQTQTSNALHNAIMEADGKDRPPMLTPGNYVQWKSRIKRYIDTKPNHELIHYCLQNPPYKYKWADKDVPVTEGSSETTIERYMENYKNVSQDIRDQLNAKVEAVQIILTGIDNNIYSTVDACPNACEMWKAIESLKQGESINVQDLETNLNQCDVTNHQVNVQFLLQLQPQWKGFVTLVKQSQELKTVSYHKLYDILKQHQNEVNKIRAERLAQVIPYVVDNYGPIFDSEPLQKVSNNDNYNVFAIESEHPEQSISVHDTYPIEQDEHNMIIDSLDMRYDREQIDQDDDDDLANERDLLASLLEKLKCEIDDSKNHNKFLETSNKALVDKLQGQIEDFKTKNKSLESSNNHFKEANNELSKTNQLMYKDLKNFQTELDKYHDVKYASKVEIDSPESDEVIPLEKENRSKLSDLIRPFDYEKLNNLYDLFVPQREKSSAQRYFSKRSKMSHPPVNNENLKESFNKQTTLLEKRMDESILWDQKCKSSKELFKIKKSVDTISDGVERCKQKIAKRTYFGHIDPFIQNTIQENYCPEIQRINADLEKFHLCLKEEMVTDLRYFNSLKLEVDSLKSQLETQKTRFLNEIDRISREYYYADHMNAILGVYTKLDEVTNLQYSLERKDCSKSKSVTKNNVSNDFLKPVTTQILPLNKKSILKNTNVLAPGMYKLYTKPIQTRTTQLPRDFRKTNKRVSFSTGVIPPSSVSRPQLKSNQIEDRVMLDHSQGKKQEVEDHRMNVKFSKNKTSVTACNDSLNVKTSNVNFVCVTCGKYVLNDNHDKCVLHNINGVNSRTKMPMVVPISTREPTRTVNQSVTKPLRRTVVIESTNQKPRHTTRKLYEHLTKICSWWYPKFTPPGYKWKPKSQIGNVNPNVSMPLGNASRTANILEPMTPRRSTVSNTTLYSSSFVARRDYHIHRQLWVLKAEAIATVCFTQNRSLVIPRHKKTPYHIINDRKPSVKFFHIFGSLSYIVRDGENLDKMKEKSDACIFVGYSTQSRAYRVFYKRTRVIVETIHVNFDELPQMASDYVSSDPVPQCPITELEHVSLSPGPQCQDNVPHAAGTVTTSNELDLLFSPMFNELLNGSTQVVSKSFAETTADASISCQQQHTTPLNTQTTPEPTCQVPTQAPTVTSTENINQAEMITENAQVEDDEFINIFYTSLESDGEMCMFALTVSRTEPKNIKEAMADSAWIESMQEELHQFDRLDVWELVDRPLWGIYLLIYGHAYDTSKGQHVWHLPEKVYNYEETLCKRSKKYVKLNNGDRVSASEKVDSKNLLDRVSSSKRMVF